MFSPFARCASGAFSGRDTHALCPDACFRQDSRKAQTVLIVRCGRTPLRQSQTHC
jgi:hypothetical protein